MKADKATRLLGELRELIDRWELELDAKPLWWRKHPATGSGEAQSSLPADVRKKVASPHPNSRKTSAQGAVRAGRAARGSAKGGGLGEAAAARR